MYLLYLTSALITMSCYSLLAIILCTLSYIFDFMIIISSRNLTNIQVELVPYHCETISLRNFELVFLLLNE